MKSNLIALAGVALLASACTSTGNVERSAAIGTGLGAIAGAVVGNNVGGGNAANGALIGAALFGSAGAVVGCQADGACGAAAPATSRRQYYDQRAGRYYYYDTATRRYFWEDGSPR